MLVSVDALELGNVSVGELPVPVGKLETEMLSTVLAEAAVPVDVEAADAGVIVDRIEVTPPMSEVTPDITVARGTGTTETPSDVVEVDSAADESVVTAAAGIDVVGLVLGTSVPTGEGIAVSTAPEGPNSVVLTVVTVDDRSDATGWSPVTVAAEGLVLLGELELAAGRVPKGPKTVLEPDISAETVEPDVSVANGESIEVTEVEVVAGTTTAGRPSTDPPEAALEAVFEVAGTTVAGRPLTDPPEGALEAALEAVFEVAGTTVAGRPLTDPPEGVLEAALEAALEVAGTTIAGSPPVDPPEEALEAAFEVAGTTITGIPPVDPPEKPDEASLDAALEAPSSEPDVSLVDTESVDTAGVKIVAGTTIAGRPPEEPPKKLPEALEGVVEGPEVSDDSEELAGTIISGTPPVEPNTTVDDGLGADALDETVKAVSASVVVEVAVIAEALL